MPNVLWIVLDDASQREFGCYSTQPFICGTPNIDALAAAGVKYTRFFSCPFCSPTRAQGLTGRDPEDTGVGQLVDDDGVLALNPSEILLPRALKARSRGRCRCGAFGKWHLANASNGNEWGAVNAGFDVSAVSKRNLPGFAPTGGYYVWERIVNGVPTTCTTYATTQAVDDAIAFCNGQGGRPFFCYLPLHAPHDPVDRPPAALYDATAYSAYWTATYGTAVPYPLPAPTGPPGVKVPYFKAMLRATDTEIGRLVASLSPSVAAELAIVITSDNGTQATSVDDPALALKSKRTVFNNGVNMPLIIAGAGVVAGGRTCEQLASTADIFPTIGDLMGIDVYGALPPGRVRRGISLMPTIVDASGTTSRQYLATGSFSPNTPNRGTNVGFRAFVEGEYKYIIDTTPGVPRESLYKWLADYDENDNLLESIGIESLTGADLAAFTSLRARAATYFASVAVRGLAPT